MRSTTHRYSHLLVRGLWVLVACLLVILAACSERAPASPALHTPSPQLPSTSAPLVSPPLTPSPLPPASVAAAPASTDPAPDVSASSPRYVISATLDYAGHHLAADEQVTYTNRSNDPLTDVPLMVEATYFPNTFKLNRLTWGDGTPVKDIEWQTGQARLKLPQPLMPGAGLGLSISYELSLPSPTPNPLVRPIPFGYTARQTNLVDWYPFIPPYVQGKGWLAHPAGYFGEHLVYETSDFQVNVRIADPRSDLVLAASAADDFKDGVHHFVMPAARNFVFSVSPDYQVGTEKVGETTVQSYTFSAHAKSGQAVLKATAQALAVYNELFGQYPRQLLSVVEADFLDGMEYDGLYFLSNGFYNLYQGTNAEYLITIAAHETSHQWWYALVGNDQAMEPWLDEAMATYSERIFYERTDPQSLDWWWAYRVNYYNPRGWVNGSIYNPDGYRAYRDAVYLNGALFLEDLRKLTGDQQFFAFLKDYAAQNAHQVATAESFFAILKKHTQADLSPLLQKYFHP